MLTKRLYRILLSAISLFLIALVIIACSSSGQDPGDGAADDGDDDEDSDAANILLADINDWGYWLSDPDVHAITESDFDLIVMDYSSDGSEEGEFTEEEITAIKDSGKIVLAYMSIGEAEEDRFYFGPAWVDEQHDLTDDAPDYLAESNPDFPDNYKVRFWQPDWQAVIYGTQDGEEKSYLDRIIDQGFDGVYLDIIDAYEYFSIGGDDPENDEAASDMIEFVIAIADYARDTRGVENFLVFPQNGAAILDEQDASEYLDAVDGIGAEDTFYFGAEENDNDLDLDHADEVTPYLDQFIDAGKTVLAIDYVQDEAKIDDFYERAADLHYIPYASSRDLDSLSVNPGHEPD